MYGLRTLQASPSGSDVPGGADEPNRMVTVTEKKDCDSYTYRALGRREACEQATGGRATRPPPETRKTQSQLYGRRPSSYPRPTPTRVHPTVTDYSTRGTMELCPSAANWRLWFENGSWRGED